MGKIFELTAKLLTERKHSKAWHRLSMLIACLVVFTTTYSMILPALTFDEVTASEEPGFDMGAAETEQAVPAEDVSQNEYFAEEPIQNDSNYTIDTGSTDASELVVEEEPAAVPAADTTNVYDNTVPAEEAGFAPEGDGEVVDFSDTEEPETILTYEDAEVRITASFEDSAYEIPAGLTLKVAPIAYGSEQYNALNDGANERLTEIGNYVISYSTYYDIWLELNGETVIPALNVKLEAQYKNRDLGETGVKLFSYNYDGNAITLHDDVTWGVYDDSDPTWPWRSSFTFRTHGGDVTGHTIAGLLNTEVVEKETADDEAEVSEEEAAVPEENAEPETTIEETATEETVPEETQLAEEAVIESDEYLEEDEFELANEDIVPVEETEDELTEAEAVGDAAADDEAAAEETSEEADSEEASLYKVGQIVYNGSDYTVELNVPEEAHIPSDAELKVDEIDPESDAYKEYYDQAMAAINEEGRELEAGFARFFDIRFEKDGVEIEPNPLARIDVKINFAQTVEQQNETENAQTGDVSAVHFAEDAVQEIEVEVENQGQAADVAEISFEASSFSVFGFVYTVDFETVDGGEYSVPGEGTYKLNDLLPYIIGKEGTVSDATLELVEGEYFEGALYLTQDEAGDWYINSDIPFTDTYLLTMTVDGVKYEVKVTDAVGEVNLENIAKSPADGGITMALSATQSSTDISRSGTVSIHMQYAIDDAKLALARANNTWVYDLSDFFSDPNNPFSGFPDGVPQSGPITENNMTKGRYYIEGDKVYFEMNQSYINTHTEITGTLDITLQLDETKVGSSGSDTITFPGSNDEVTLTYKAVDVTDSWKGVNNSNTGTATGGTPIVAVQQENGNYKLNYTASVRPNAALDSLVMRDTLGAGQTVDKSSFVIKTESGKTYTVPASAVSDATGGFTLDIASVVKAAGDTIKSGTKYEISYSTIVDADKVEGNTQITNQISWEWDGGSKPTNETNVIPRRATSIDKSVVAADDSSDEYLKLLTYTITVGDSINKDVSGVTVRDFMQDYQKLDGSSIVITDASGTPVHTISGSELKWTDDDIFGENQKALFEYTFPEGSNNGPYTITYTTRVPADVGRDGQVNITNTAQTGDGGSDNTGVPVDFGTRPGPGASIDKRFVDWEGKDNDGKVTSGWAIDVNVAADADLPLQNVVVTEADCFTAPAGWYPRTDAVIDYTNIVVKDKNGSVITSGYTVDGSAGTITFAELSESVTIELSATSSEAMPDNGWFENNASLTVNGKPGNSDKDNRQYGSTTFDKSVSYDESSEIFTWTVKLNTLRNEVQPDVPVYFSDLLPEGMQLLNYTTGGTDNPSIHVNTGGTAGYYEWNQDVTVAGREIQRTNITAFTGYDYATHAAAALSGTDYTITYKTKLTDSELASFANDDDAKKTYLNTAFYYHNETDEADGQATRDVEYEYKVVDKAVKGVTKDIIDYEISVNPKALRLNGGQEMTLVDTLNTTNIDLLLDSVQIKDENGNGVVGASVVYNDDMRTLSITVPDEMHVIVTYQVIAQNLGEQTFRNTAELKGNLTWTDEDISTRTIGSHGSTVHGSGNVSLRKIDENYDIKPDGKTEPKPLSRAKFALYEQPIEFSISGDDTEGWIASGSGNTTGPATRINRDGETDSVFESGSEGTVLFDGVIIEKYDKLYYWEEIEAPEGYQLDGTKHYFVMYDSDQNQEVEEKNKDKADLLDKAATRVDQGIIINKVATGATWTVVNRTDGLTVDVKKAWKDSAGADKAFDEDQTIYFKLYQVVGDGAPTLYDPTSTNPSFTHANYVGNGIWKIDYTASTHTWGTASITGLPEKVNEVACKYYVEEVNQNGSILSSKKDYAVSYKAGSNQEKDDASEAALGRNGSIIISNRDYVSISARKVWNDNQNADGLRPQTITLHLLQDGKRMDKSYDKIIEDDGSGNWTAEWTQLPGGRTYSVEEDPIPGYDVTYEPAAGLNQAGVITVTNTDNRAQLRVEKKWVNDSGEEVTAPDNVSVTVQLKKNGVTVDTQTVSAPDWSYTWKLLDYDSTATYTIEEDTSKLPNGFEQYGTTTYTNTGDNESVTDKVMDGGTAVVKNKPATEQPDKTQVVVQKQWVDKDGNALPAAQVADKSATVQLVRYKSEKVGTTVHYVFKGDGGPKGDDSFMAGTVNITTTNSLAMSASTATPNEVGEPWRVNSGQPGHITGNSYGSQNTLSFEVDGTGDVYIYFWADPGEITSSGQEAAGNTPVGPEIVENATLTLTAPNFNGQFYNLPSTEIDAGTNITYNLRYAIQEIAVDGFTTQYSTDGETFEDSIAPEDAVSGTGQKTITVKNTFIPVEAEMSVEKTWITKQGTEWPSGATVEVTLKKTVDGVTTDVPAAELVSCGSDQRQNPVTLTSTRTGTTWNHLPVVENVGGTDYDITYSVVEGTVTGVDPADFITETTTSTDGKDTFIINAEKITVPVTKTWAEDLPNGTNWTATFDLKVQKRLMLVNGVEATMSEIMAVEGVDDEGWSEAENVKNGADNVAVTLTNADSTEKNFENLPVSETDADGNTYMLRYTAEESSLTINDVPSLTMYSAEATNASPDNDYVGISVTNTLITVDVPVEKTWDDFDADGADWSAVMRLQWAPIYEGESHATSEFNDVEPIQQITIDKAMMADRAATLDERTFKNLPKYGYDQVSNRPYRIQYSVEEMSYTATAGGTTYTFVKSTTPGVPDSYTPAGEENQYIPFFPHDGGELSEADSDYYVQVSNHKRNTKDKQYLELKVSKTWTDSEILNRDDAYATFQVKYNKRVDSRDISHMSDEDKAANPITVILKDINGNPLDEIHVRPNTGIHVNLTLRTAQQNGATVTGTASGCGNNGSFSQYVQGGDKASFLVSGTFYPSSTDNVITLNITGGDGIIESAELTDTTPGSSSGTALDGPSFTLNKSNRWSTDLSLLSEETLNTSTNPNVENVEVYEYYLVETGSNPEGFAAKFLKAGTEIEDGDQYNPIKKDTTIEARNEPEAKLVVKKAWRGVPDTKGYPPVYFTLYQCKPGAGMEENGKTIFTAEDGTQFIDIELKHSDNPEEDYTWTCPITLPLRDSEGNRLAYYVIESPNSGNWKGTGWSNYGYSQEQDPVTFEYTHEADSGQPIVAQLVGNNGTLIIHNRVSDYHEMDVKKQYFMIKEDGSWYNVTADMTRNVVLGFKVIRRAVDPNTGAHLSGWEDYGDEMLCGYGPNGEDLQDNGTNDFWLQYAGLWHWTIHNMNDQQVHGHVGLPLTGYYTPKGATEPVTAKFQYSFRETNVYKDLQRTPYPDWEWYSSIVPDRYMNQQGGQVSGEFGLAFPNHDGERVVNYQASDLLVTKRWIGQPNAKEVYVKIWRKSDNGPLEDFTAEISKDIRGDYPESHPAYGNSNWQGFLEDTSEIDATVGHEWLVLAAQPDGDWTSKMKIHNALIKTTGEGGWYTYYIEEVGYKDKNGDVHMKGDDPDPFVNLETHYTRWVGGKYGHWEVNPLTDGSEKSISIGATGENKLQVMNAPRMDLTVNKEWFDINGDPTTPWKDSVTFQIEQVATKWVQGAPTSETRTTKVKIGGQDTFTLSKTASENKYLTVDVSDHEGRHDTYVVTNDESAEKAEAWTFYVDGLYEGFFDANNDEWHCVYTIKEVDVTKSDVIIKNNGVSSDGETVTIENHYSETASIKVTKTFSGIDALPDNFKINAHWTDATNVEHDIDLTVNGEQPPNVTLDGDGSAENPYVWTISKIKVNHGDDPAISVIFTESGFEAEGYTVTVSSSDNNVDNDNPETTVEVHSDEIRRGDFTNTYDRISGGLKVEKIVTVNDAETTGTLADGEYTFRLLEADAITQAKDKYGELVEDFSITINNGTAEPIEIDNLIPGDYYVLEINGTNKAVTLDYVPKPVTVEANKINDDIAATGIATITNNLETTTVNADKKWVDGAEVELANWPTGAKATFGVYAGTSTTPLAQVELDGTATETADIPANGDTPAGYEANKEVETEGGGLAIFKNLPKKDKNGKTIVYTIKEIGEPTGFVNLTPDGVSNGGTITNKETPQNGSLKLTKIVTINGDTPAQAQYSDVDGSYTFSIVGPSDSEPAEQVTKFVQIAVTDGQMASYKISEKNTSEAWDAINPTPGTEALIEDLAEGDYVVTELEVEGMFVSAITGGKLTGEPPKNNANLAARTVTVHVTAGDTEAAQEGASAEYTNNKSFIDIKIIKIDETTRSSASQTKLPAAEFQLFKYTPNPGGTSGNYTVYPDQAGSTKTTISETGDSYGTLTFSGLPDGQYKITETKAPAGYVKLSDNDIYFDIVNGVLKRYKTAYTGVARVTADEIAEDAKILDITYKKVSGSNNVEFTVGNTPGAGLPNTGGHGTLPFKVSGSILLAFSALMYVTSFRRRREEALARTGGYFEGDAEREAMRGGGSRR